VATPIGNLGDLAPRAVEELARADVVACEDTRRTGKLLERAGLRARQLTVVNDHNEARAARALLERLDRGDRVAVVTDAGMPGVSDPGERLVRAAVRAGHRVEVIPGPSAAITALVASGLPTGRFCFEGFLSRRAGPRRQRLAELAAEPRTLVFYEAPHRAAETLADLAGAFGGGRRVAVARELTKLHEEIWRGPLDEAAAWAAATPPRGEIALVVEGAPGAEAADDAAVEAAVRRHLDDGASARDAAAAVAVELSVPKRRAYAAATRLKG
jgi:16S rRNA (cytidine1402-2'-O)-methyltransferase